MFYGMTVKEYVAIQEDAERSMYCSSWWDTGKGLVNLTKEGKLAIIDKDGKRERDWYKDSKTGKPWFPKFKNFKSLVKQIVREDGAL